MKWIPFWCLFLIASSIHALHEDDFNALLTLNTTYNLGWLDGSHTSTNVCAMLTDRITCAIVEAYDRITLMYVKDVKKETLFTLVVILIIPPLKKYLI